jgi:hypothetical protein
MLLDEFKQTSRNPHMNFRGLLFFGFSMFLLTMSTALVGDITSELGTFCKIDCPVKPKKKCRCCSPKKHHMHHRHHGTHPHIPLLEGTSLNWSGYAAITSILHPTNESVTSVSGSWTVPALSASTDQTYCSIWVGIDGFSSSTVEQIGTEHDWSGRSQSNYAWFEMYPSGSYEIEGFPVDIHARVKTHSS